jgi:hypothetical protein
MCSLGLREVIENFNSFMIPLETKRREAQIKPPIHLMDNCQLRSGHERVVFKLMAHSSNPSIQNYPHRKIEGVIDSCHLSVLLVAYLFTKSEKDFATKRL